MNALLNKLKIASPHVLYTINAPDDFETTLQDLPEGIRIVHNRKVAFNSIHWFVKSKREVDTQAPEIIGLLKEGITVWCYFPKGSSKIQTDLTRDKGWESLMQPALKWINLISFDATWSAFAFRLKTEKDMKAETNTKEREIFKYADSATKTITLPDDLARPLNKNKAAKTFFDSLSFSNRREYVEWIISAKREETRARRVNDALSMLMRKQPNPQNR
jgi:hypothetical protein